MAENEEFRDLATKLASMSDTISGFIKSNIDLLKIVQEAQKKMYILSDSLRAMREQLKEE